MRNLVEQEVGQSEVIEMPPSVYLLVPLMTLVPMIPAYVLFKTLGGKAEVTGAEFYGFNVKLGGAFAGYFALLLLLYFIFKPFLVPSPTRLVYRLEGQILDDKQQGVPLTSDNFALMPSPVPMIAADHNGHFSVSFIVDPDTGNSLRYPSIEVSYRDYLPTDLFLDPNPRSSHAQTRLQLTRDDAHQVIYAMPISLTRADTTKGGVHVATPQPITGIAAEYTKIGRVEPTEAPPGYGSAAKGVAVPQ